MYYEFSVGQTTAEVTGR